VRDGRWQGGGFSHEKGAALRIAATFVNGGRFRKKQLFAIKTIANKKIFHQLNQLLKT
jgi:hypothetical protein